MATPDFPSQRWRWEPLPSGHYSGGGRTGDQPSVVVIHCTANPRATNENEVAYADRRTDEVSAHFYVDGDDVIQTVRVADRAWSAHSMGNARGVHIELSADGGWTRAQWLEHPGMIALAGQVVAAVGVRCGIVIRQLRATQLQAGERGVCGHSDMVAAYHQGDHWHCPGDNFPWDALLSAAGLVPPPPPPPPPPAPVPAAWTESLLMELPTLSRGATGPPARRVQGLLCATGYLVAIDGDWGPLTDAAVRRWQAERRVPASVRADGTGDGIWGPASWRTSLGLA